MSAHTSIQLYVYTLKSGPAEVWKQSHKRMVINLLLNPLFCVSYVPHAFVMLFQSSRKLTSQVYSV